MLQESEFTEWPDSKPCPADNILSVDKPYIGITAVRAVIAVITHYKILIVAKSDWFCSCSGIIDSLSAIMFI